MEQPLQCTQGVQPVRKRKRKHRRRCKRHPQDGPHSPTCRGQKTGDVTESPALVRALPSLKPVLDYLNVTGEIFTRAEIISHLIEYIKKKALYDPNDPRKVYCDNDPLGKVFGCKEFSTANACELLLQNLEDVPSMKNPEPRGSKRKRSNFTRPPTSSISATDTCSCSESDQQSFSDQPCSSQSLSSWQHGVKRTYESAFSGTINVLASVTSTSCSESKDSAVVTEYSEHYKSICDNVTDVVTDTSDDLFFLYETDEERVVRAVDSDVSIVISETEERSIVTGLGSDEFDVEYEPISFSDEERLVATHGVEQEATEDSEDTEVDEGEDGGDELGNSDSSDSEIEEDDKWPCQACPERNHPMTRRCRRCWAVREDWFPSALERTSSDPGRIRNSTVTSTITNEGTLSDSASTSRAVGPIVVNEPSDSTASESKDSYGRMKCILCRKEPPNGCIVHGTTGHQVCCVECAKKLKDNNRPCPVCRKKIRRVIKNFM